MNNIQKLIKLRGETIFTVAEKTGLNYHSIQKVITGVRDSAHIKEKVAQHLGLSFGHVWGDRSDRFLAKYIQTEINRRAEAERERLRAKYLSKAA